MIGTCSLIYFKRTLMARKDLPKVSFLNFGVAFLLFALTQFGIARREYTKSDTDFKFSITLFIIFISLSFLMFGIHIGIKITESQINKR